MGKTAIVLGATGLVGKELVNQLTRAPFIDKVIAITRRQVSYESPKVFNQIVDFDHLEKYADVFKGDYLFSALGTTIKQAGTIEAQRKVDLEYQFTAARLASVNGVTHYLLVSSAMANASSQNPYIKMKGELEENVGALGFQRISIFQPGLLAGERDHVRIGEVIAGAILPVLSFIPGLRRFRPIHAQQVAARMIQVSQSDGPALKRYALEDVFPV